MSGSGQLVLLTFIAFFFFSATVGAQVKLRPDELRASHVRKSIEDGVNFLVRMARTRQDNWDSINDWPGGGTGLVTLALLNCGVSPESNEISSALRHFSQTPSGAERSTYVVSLRVMCIVAAGESGKRYRRLLEEDVQWLVDQQLDNGGWSYSNRHGGGGDMSNSQFALLALHDARVAGVAIERRVWERADRYWRETLYDRSQGSFGYSGPTSTNGARTCAGISSLIIIRENLDRAADHLVGGRVVCCGDDPVDKQLQAAMQWLASNFRVNGNPRPGGMDNGKYYYLYGMERAGRLSGQRFFGTHDWYREGATELVSDQSKRLVGSWANPSGHLENMEEVASSLALLFLSKGLRPVLFGRYELPESGLGQLHPTGLHYMTRQVEQAWNIPLNWQTVDATKADVNDLRESPVLFISGRDEIRLNAQQKSELKRYIESGKFVFAEACQGDGCGDNVAFDRSFRELMAELFPESRLEPLGVDHPVWNAHFQIRQPDAGWPLLGLQACCRTSVVFCPRNLSGYWQLDRPGIFEDCPEAVQKQIGYCRQIGVNVAAYATNRVLEEKLDVNELGDSVVESLTGRALVFPKLRLGGGDDDAASAWGNIQDFVASESSLQIDREKRFVSPNLEQMSDYTMLFSHGRQRFNLGPEQREAIRQYIDNGGFLFVDTICSSPDFADAFRREMAQIFPDHSLQPIPPEHPLWNDSKFGFPLAKDRVELRHPDSQAANGYRAEMTVPKLEGIEIEGRMVVIFSPFDLSCAMENASASNCEGYKRDDAAKIATNVILYRMRAD